MVCDSYCISLDDAISHAEEVADRLAESSGNSYDKCAAEHRQLAGWLSELRMLKPPLAEDMPVRSYASPEDFRSYYEALATCIRSHRELAVRYAEEYIRCMFRVLKHNARRQLKHLADICREGFIGPTHTKRIRGSIAKCNQMIDTLDKLDLFFEIETFFGTGNGSVDSILEILDWLWRYPDAAMRHILTEMIKARKDTLRWYRESLIRMRAEGQMFTQEDSEKCQEIERGTVLGIKHLVWVRNLCKGLRIKPDRHTPEHRALRSSLYRYFRKTSPD